MNGPSVAADRRQCCGWKSLPYPPYCSMLVPTPQDAVAAWYGILAVRSKCKEQCMPQIAARISSKGQVTIPRAVRQALRLRQGDSVIFEIDEQGVRLRPQHPADIFTRYAGMLRSGEGQTIAAIVAATRAQR